MARILTHCKFATFVTDLMLSQQPAAAASTSPQHSTLSIVSDQNPPSLCSLVHTENGLPPALMSSGHVKLQPVWSPAYEIILKWE